MTMPSDGDLVHVSLPWAVWKRYAQALASAGVSPVDRALVDLIGHVYRAMHGQYPGPKRKP